MLWLICYHERPWTAPSHPPPPHSIPLIERNSNEPQMNNSNLWMRYKREKLMLSVCTIFKYFENSKSFLFSLLKTCETHIFPTLQSMIWGTAKKPERKNLGSLPLSLTLQVSEKMCEFNSTVCRYCRCSAVYAFRRRCEWMRGQCKRIFYAEEEEEGKNPKDTKQAKTQEG